MPGSSATNSCASCGRMRRPDEENDPWWLHHTDLFCPSCVAFARGYTRNPDWPAGADDYDPVPKARRTAIIAALICLALVALLLLTSCAQGVDVTKGVPAKVVSHSYDDPDDWTTMTPITHQSCSGTKYRVCTNYTTYVPIHHHDGPHWRLQLWQCGHKTKKTKKNPDGCTTFWKEVTQLTYDSNENGKWVTFT